LGPKGGQKCKPRSRNAERAKHGRRKKVGEIAWFKGGQKPGFGSAGRKLNKLPEKE